MAFRDRTIKYNFVGAPPEWMQQMHEVFAQWQAEIAQQAQMRRQSFAPPPPPPGVAPYAPQPQQWNVAQPPPQGYASPQLLPNSPVSNYSSSSPPPMPLHGPPSMALHQPGLYAYQPPAQQFAPVEMMGSLPSGPPARGMLAAPPPPQPAPSVTSEVGSLQTPEVLEDADS